MKIVYFVPLNKKTNRFLKDSCLFMESGYRNGYPVTENAEKTIRDILAREGFEENQDYGTEVQE